MRETSKADSCVMLETRDNGARWTCNDSLPCQTFPVMIYTDCCSASHREYRDVYGLFREPGAQKVDLERPSKLNAARIVDKRDQTKEYL